MVTLTVQLTACGGGGGGGGGGTSGNGTVDIANAVKISGSVGDGPLTGATIVVYADNGKELGTMTSDSTAFFHSIINVKASDYPLVIKTTDGFDLVTGAAPAFEMLSVMSSPTDKQQNINPFTTMIVKTAQRLPGALTAVNIETARTFVMNTLGFGLDPNLIPDPITTKIKASNAANMIKASEVLSEMIRRTSSTLSTAGEQVSSDDVVTALAADLTDGFLDGHGAHGADARVATVAAVVSAQVLVEALRNALKVDGLVATTLLDEALRITLPRISSSQLTAGVRITAGMLKQTKIALATAMVVDSSSKVEEIVTRVDTIALNALPSDVAGVLATDASITLMNAVVQSASAAKQHIKTIRQVILGADSTDGSINDSVNHAPVIDGTPVSSAVVNSTYSFQPSATDADGDKLSFIISNKPSWAKFSRKTGKLSGTPGKKRVGSYDNIMISVSDGESIAALSPFSIQVENATGNTGRAMTGSLALNWKAPVSRTDGTPLSLADIDGYRIHYGKSSGNYINHFTLADGTAQKVKLTNIPVGTYYLVMTTYDVYGRESGYSSQVIKTVQ